MLLIQPYRLEKYNRNVNQKIPFFFSLSISLKTTEVIRANSKAKTKPHQKLSILKPRTKRLASKTTSVFTTKRNKPRVMIVNGRVRIIKTGFTNTFNTANIKAKIN